MDRSISRYIKVIIFPGNKERQSSWLVGVFWFEVFFFLLLSLQMKTTAGKQQGCDIILKVQMLNFRKILAIYTYKLNICKYSPFNDQTSKLQIRTSLRHYFKSHPAKKTCQLSKNSFLPFLRFLLCFKKALNVHLHNWDTEDPFALKVLSVPLRVFYVVKSQKENTLPKFLLQEQSKW